MPKLILPNENELNNVEGILALDEGRHLAYCASIVPKDQNIVEIGGLKGKATCFCGMGSFYGNRARVYSLDPWDLHYGEIGKTYHSEFQENVKQFELESIVTSIVGYSYEVVKNWNAPIGLLFIDGDHYYDSVRKDYELWAPFIAEGGWIAFHDINDIWPDVKRVIDEMIIPSDLWSHKMVLPTDYGFFMARRNHVPFHR
ncbi:class I SAM-dependent methyltransferase [Effusibacillus consociatus]|uniref:Class I SAM-dependent methyltransferase n=1 Tax=Effusibacillus consociatus TaxID=1117041 RepID=A0ABV9PXU6_9BACL